MEKRALGVSAFLTEITGLTGCGAGLASFSRQGQKSPGESRLDSSAPVIAGQEKKAVLVVSFGTSYRLSGEASIGAVERAIAAAFPEYEVRRAYTSQVIIDKLASRDNLEIDNVRQAMERLAGDGFDTVICQPTHVVNGYEYDKMVRQITPYIGRFHSIKFGTPLLTSIEDYRETVKALVAELPALTEKEAVVLVGHGTEHYANATYSALDYRFQDDGFANIFVGTVEGYPSMQSVLKQLKAKPEIEKVYLAPLLIVAGDHANTDIAGSEEGTWKTTLQSEGYSVEGILKGLGEYHGIRELFVKHVQAAVGG